MFLVVSEIYGKFIKKFSHICTTKLKHFFETAKFRTQLFWGACPILSLWQCDVLFWQTKKRKIRLVQPLFVIGASADEAADGK